MIVKRRILKPLQKSAGVFLKLTVIYFKPYVSKQMDIILGHNSEAVHNFFKKAKDVKCIAMQNINHLTYIQVSMRFTFLKEKLSVKHPVNKQDLKIAAVKAGQSIITEETQRLRLWVTKFGQQQGNS